MRKRGRNIVILGPAHPLRGGMAALNQRLAQAFEENGDSVKILSFSLQYPRIFFPGKTQYTSDPKPDLDIEECVNSVNPFNWIKIGRRVRKMNPDILLFRYWIPFMAPCFGTIARLVRKNRHTLILSIVDNAIPHEHRPFDRTLTRYFVKSIGGFLTMSHAVTDDLRTFDTKKPIVFNHHPLYDNYGASVERAAAVEKLKLDKETRYLLFFGLIRDYKGLDLLLHAMADDRIKRLPLKLIIAGEFYSDKKSYLKIIDQHQLQERIIMHDYFVSDEDVTYFFAAADLLVQPYKSATQSGVAKIAYHFEKPLLVTDVGGLSEVVLDGKTGFVVDPDPVQIADKIVLFYKNDSLGAFVENIKEEKKKYSWETMVDSLWDLSQQVEDQKGD